MKALDFSFVPRSTMQQDQARSQDMQANFGDRLSKSVGELADSFTAKRNAELQAKAQEIQAQALREWNASEGMFKGIADDASKAKKVASLLSPFNKLMSDRWLDMANKYAQEAGELQQKNLDRDADVSKSYAKSQADILKLQADKDLKQQELDAKKAEQDKKVSIDYKTALGAFTSGKYPNFYANSTIAEQSILPDPTADKDLIESSLQAGVSGDAVKAKTIAQGVTKANQDIKQGALGIQKDTLLMPESQLKGEEANRELKYNDTQAGRLSDSAKKEVDVIKSRYEKIKDAFDNWKLQFRKLEALLPKNGGDLKNFDTIAAIVLFNKIIDPMSVVREAEFEVAQSSGSAWDGLKNKVGSFFSGKTLNADDVANLKRFMKSQQDLADTIEQEIKQKTMAQLSYQGANMNDIGVFSGKQQETAQPAKPSTQQPTPQPQPNATASGVVSLGALKK